MSAVKLNRLGALPLLTVLSLVAVASLLGALLAGSAHLSAAEVWQAILSTDGSTHRTVVLDLRLPRALAAFATGGLLAMAGALMQVLLRNPLADPYILGVSGGAAVFALSALMLGFAGIWVETSAFGGALLVTLLVFALAHRPGGWTPVRLLLTGVVIASGLGAVISLLLALSPDASVRGMLFWLMGDLSFANRPGRSLLLLALGVMAAFVLSRQLNVLARGDSQARVLGVAVKPMRIIIYLLSSLMTAVAVTTAGSIGFIGLVVPHLVRQLAGPDHRIVLPSSALLGGALLVAADTLARTVVAPTQLPVGALTALLGVPLFLVLLNRQRTVLQ